MTRAIVLLVSPPVLITGRTQEGYSDFMSGVWDTYARARDSAGWTWDEAQVGCGGRCKLWSAACYKLLTFKARPGLRRRWVGAGVTRAAVEQACAGTEHLAGWQLGK